MQRRRHCVRALTSIKVVMSISITETTTDRTDGVRSFTLQHGDEQIIASVSIIERHNTSLHDESPRFAQLPGGSLLTNGQIADLFTHLVSALNHQRITRHLG